MSSRPFTRIIRRASATAGALALIAAPAAFAIAPDQHLAVRNASAPHLTAAQLKAIDGHQPLDPQLVPSTPAAQQPQVKESDSSSWRPAAWLIALMAGGAVTLAGGAFLVVSRKSLVPHRSRAGV